MQANRPLLIVALLAGLILLGGSAGASNLTLSKGVDGGTSYQSGENITWIIAVTNHNATIETGVQVIEQIPPGCIIEEYLSHNGTIAGNVWTIDLAPGANETLKLNMSCTSICGSRSFVNTARIISPDPSLDDNAADNNDTASVTVTAPQCLSSNLSLAKSVVGTGTYRSGDNITWRVDLRNNNVTESLPVTVTEHIPTGCVLQNSQVSEGTFQGGIWSLNIAAGSTETLQINVSCTRLCGSQTITNIANITSPAGVDVNLADNNVTSTVTVEGSTCANITVRPITLNLKSKGVLTVFFTVGGQLKAVAEEDEEEVEDTGAVHINPKGSTLACNEVNASRILFSMKDGGTVIGKFQRQALAFEVTEGMSRLDCEGTILFTDGRSVSIQGNNTIKVIHAEAARKQSLILRILVFIGLVSDTELGENVEQTPAMTINIDDIKNLGQLKKILKTITPEEETAGRDTAVTTTTPGKDKQDNKGNENSNGKKDTPPDQSKGKGKGNS
ncbi:MAG: DUF11 domain-containing protein [Methanomicrobiales archaeon]|nr:DUF11 domain-containing protein [Methanomicrobiales archaeon]